MGECSSVRAFTRKGPLWVFLTGFALFMGPAMAFGAEAHVFDPVLSLTGSCKTQPVDTVPDPGLCPGVLGVDHPNNPFSVPTSVATDSYGLIFVGSFGQKLSGEEARVDIFSSSGFYLSELAVPTGVRSIAVDGAGHLYMINKERELLRYDPAKYNPAAGEIEYKTSPKVVAGESPATFVGLAVNPVNNRVFANYGNGTVGGNPGEFISEYGSAVEGNEFIETIGKGTLGASYGIGLAIDVTRGRIYASDLSHSGEVPDPAAIRVFELNPPHKLVESIDGSTVPGGKLIGLPSIAVEELTGNIFTYEGGGEVVYELTEAGKYLGTIDHELQGHDIFGAEITVDNGENSPNGMLNPFGRSYLYVPAYPSGAGHSFAFGPPKECKPVIEASSFSGVTETEAHLLAEIEPCNLETTYVFEYTTQENFEAEGFAGATAAGEGKIPAGLAPVDVAAGVSGLSPGTAYHFRVVATNGLGEDEAKGEFATYPSEPISPCSNDALRTGPEALLPDCRAYELVTPSDTNARAPFGVSRFGTYFTTREASPVGNKVSFELKGGSLPGAEAVGSLAGDPYLASRGEDGWHTTYAGPTGAEATSIIPGSNSPDQGYSFWSGQEAGSAVVEGELTSYLRYPDGHSALVGRGSLGTDPRALGRLISEDGRHVIFVSGNASPAVQLEEDAPPAGTKTIYDRTISTEGNENTHVISLLPGSLTPAAGQNADYQGASLDGKGVAFSIGKKVYLRFDDEATFEVGENVTFAGVAEGGARIFYLKGGDLFAFDVKVEETIQFTESGDVTPVNVAADGTTAYFISPTAIAAGSNPKGDSPQAGQENLYLSKEGVISFVGTVTKRDVEGEFGGVQTVDGLGLWMEAVGLGKSTTNTPGQFAIDPSRTTPDGGVLLFESRAALAGYDPEGHAEVYRYDLAGAALSCLSCNPTLAAASGEASLQSIMQNSLLGAKEPLGPYAFVPNLRADGRRAFFQSTEALVPADTDNLQDVYEWEDQGVGSCKREGGCIYLLSSGHSSRNDYLYGVGDSGDDVFFRSADLLLRSDSDETPSIYDARVEGGFPEPEEEGCQGEGCRPGLTPAPGMPNLGSSGTGPSGNVKPKKCAKGKHKITKNGKTRCVRKQHKHRAGTKKKGAGK
jgi:hypothetical protein